jgi:UDP-arabinose 4-epimerase
MISSSTETDRKPVVLVTGGAGYIGSHACKALAHAGWLPVTFDNLERGHRELVKWGPLEIGDLNDHDRIHSVIGQYKPVAVMHFAALAYVGESVEKPVLYHHNNVKGSASLLQAMRQMSQPRIIFSSTCATYGDPVEMPMTEQHPQKPVNPYGQTKLDVERLIAQEAEHCGLQFINLRYFNAAGADPEGETGELHDPETHLIPLALQAATGKIPKLQVFGDDYPTPDGTCVRDYIHVTDLVEAHVLALKYLLAGGASDSYNLANGNGYSVMQVIRVAEQVTGRKIPFEITGRRAGDPPRLIGDARRALTGLGWRPQRGDLHEIIQTAWNYEKRR